MTFTKNSTIFSELLKTIQKGQEERKQISVTEKPSTTDSSVPLTVKLALSSTQVNLVGSLPSETEFQSLKLGVDPTSVEISLKKGIQARVSGLQLLHTEKNTSGTVLKIGDGKSAADIVISFLQNKISVQGSILNPTLYGDLSPLSDFTLFFGGIRDQVRIQKIFKTILEFLPQKGKVEEISKEKKGLGTVLESMKYFI